MSNIKINLVSEISGQIDQLSDSFPYINLHYTNNNKCYKRKVNS